MAIVKEKYSGAKINLLYQLLQADAEDGRPREYDITVDDLKVVRRTTDPEKFFSHEDFIREDTRYLTISLYEGSSKRNTRYVYYLKEGVEEEKATLSGIEQSMTEKMQQQRRLWDYELLQKENEQLKGELEEQEEYIEKLEKVLDEEKGKKASIKDNWGEVFSMALEGMVRRNTHLLNGIPMIGQGLAGVVEQDNRRLEHKAENEESKVLERQASFQKVAKEETTQSEDEKQILGYHRKLQQTFSQEELATILQIIALFSQEKENITTVYQMLIGEEANDAEEQKALL